MKQAIPLQLLSLFLLLSCCNANGQDPQTSPTDLQQQAWLQVLNNGQSTTAFYLENNGLLINDQLITKATAINQQWQEWKKDKGTLAYYKLETHQLQPTEQFELGFYLDQNNQEYYTVIAWRKKAQWNKEFEVIYPASADQKNGNAKVDKMRQAWEDFSNAHRPDKIATEVCLANGYYFNRGKIHQGSDAITNVYGYMTGERWKIKLSSLSSTQVNKDIVYDIGTFESGGKGLYVLIWKKIDQSWKVLLDYNF